MKRRTSSSLAIASLMIFLAGTGWAQPPSQPTTTLTQGGYSEAVAFEGKATVQTPQGPKAVRIVMKKLHLPAGGQTARVPLPEKGLAIFQHRAGALEMMIGRTRRVPFEGEWLTVTLPETVVVKTADDSVLIDAIIVAE
jgi:hypothetical protein